MYRLSNGDTMVFRRRSKAATEQLAYQADNDEYMKVYGDFLDKLECGTKVYVPLWDKEGTIEDWSEDYIAVDGIDPVDWLSLQPWEFKIL